jgi:hypothetical protein
MPKVTKQVSITEKKADGTVVTETVAAGKKVRLPEKLTLREIDELIRKAK